MLRAFRTLRLVLGFLALGAWGVGALAVPFAEARAEGAKTFRVAHVEAPSQDPAHAVHDHARCAWCHQLRALSTPTPRLSAWFGQAPVHGAIVSARQHPVSRERGIASSRAPPQR